jgi:zinc finger CCHC domain-containing protein 9
MPKKVFKKEKLTKEQRRTKYTQIARDRSTKKRMQAAAQNLTCFQCRQRGHSLETCPLSLKAKTCCYKCGSTDHSLQTCLEKELNVPVSKMTLPFAACFVCNETGHLSSQCKQNKKGVYPTEDRASIVVAVCIWPRIVPIKK